ncbi:MAG: hypothetical protein R2762_22605 [Bryobacteraceae bacterium]
MRIPRRTLLAGTLLAPALPGADALKVTSVRRVFHNGEHNAFTDMVRFRGRFYLTFRSCPEGHMLFPSSRILVLESADGGEWRQVHAFSVKQRDVRDPHFVVFRDKLFVYTGTWYCGDGPPKTRDMNEMLGFACWSGDGRQWQGPEMLEGTYGHYIWRGAAYGGKAWLCARRKRHFVKMEDRAESVPLTQGALLESDDGIVFRKAGLFTEDYGNETAFLFEKDGTILALARGGGERNAELCIARPPYTKFERRDLGRYVGGPMIERWGDRYLAGGRRKIQPTDPATALYWLDPKKAALTEIATLPSGGDNSYPGFIALSPSRGLLSYYSTHETPKAAIFLASLEIG